MTEKVATIEIAESARDWVDALLVRVDPEAPQDRAAFLTEATSLAADVQVAVLRECVKRMPALRSDDDRRASLAAGTLLYDLACQLYKRKLPYGESDICALLESSRHTCGHGNDVTPPLDIAHAYMQRHGFSERIVGAVRQFLETLSGVGSAQAQFAKRRGAIMLLADPKEVQGSESGWSARFRETLINSPAEEREAWQRFVLAMKANDIYLPPAVWQKPAARLLATIAPRVVLERIDNWTSFEGHPKLCTVKTGGSHLLKNLVWLLDVVALDEELRPACDQLVTRLARIDWAPKERTAKFMIAAGHYLSHRPPAVAWGALESLLRWNGETPGKTRDVVERYGHEHGIAVTAQVAGPVRPKDRRAPSRREPRLNANAGPSLIRRWIANLFGHKKRSS